MGVGGGGGGEGGGMEVSSNGLCHHAHIWYKPLKVFFRIKRLMTLKLGMQYLVLKYYQVYPNDDAGLTLTYFTARSKLVPFAFVRENTQTVDILETDEFYVVKARTYSQINEYMTIYDYPRSFIDLCPRSLRFDIFNIVFLRNR